MSRSAARARRGRTSTRCEMSGVSAAAVRRLVWNSTSLPCRRPDVPAAVAVTVMALRVHDHAAVGPACSGDDARAWSAQRPSAAFRRWPKVLDMKRHRRGVGHRPGSQAREAADWSRPPAAHVTGDIGWQPAEVSAEG